MAAIDERKVATGVDAFVERAASFGKVKVRVEESGTEKGRVLIATEDLKPGDILFFEKPLIYGTYHPLRCLECDEAHNPRECPKVQTNYPKFVAENIDELQILLAQVDAFGEIDRGRAFLKALALLVKANYDNNSSKKGNNNNNNKKKTFTTKGKSEEQTQEPTFSFDVEPIASLMKLKAANLDKCRACLFDMAESEPINEIFPPVMRLPDPQKQKKRGGRFNRMKKDPKEEQHKRTAKTLLEKLAHLLAVLNTNSHEIQDGSAIFPLAAMMEHSCVPNCSFASAFTPPEIPEELKHINYWEPKHDDEDDEEEDDVEEEEEEEEEETEKPEKENADEDKHETTDAAKSREEEANKSKTEDGDDAEKEKEKKSTRAKPKLPEHKTPLLWVVAVKPVKAGEALSIDYDCSEVYRPVKERQKTLEESHEFVCKCDGCTKLPDRTRAFCCEQKDCDGIVCPIGLGENPEDFKCLKCKKQMSDEHREKCLEYEQKLEEEAKKNEEEDEDDEDDDEDDEDLSFDEDDEEEDEPEAEEEYNSEGEPTFSFDMTKKSGKKGEKSDKEDEEDADKEDEDEEEDIEKKLEQITSKKLLHETHHLVFWGVYNLARFTASSQRDGEKAEALWLRVLKSVDQVLPENHDERIIFYDTLAQIRTLKGDTDGAKEAWKKAYEISTVVAGKDTRPTLELKDLYENPPKSVEELADHYSKADSIFLESDDEEEDESGFCFDDNDLEDLDDEDDDEDDEDDCCARRTCGKGRRKHKGCKD